MSCGSLDFKVDLKVDSSVKWQMHIVGNSDFAAGGGRNFSPTLTPASLFCCQVAMLLICYSLFLCCSSLEIFHKSNRCKCNLVTINTCVAHIQMTLGFSGIFT